MTGNQEITFLGGINTDDDIRFVGRGDYRYSTYSRSGSAEAQNAGALESMPGNALIENNNLPSGTNQVLGSAKWLENESIVYFVYNSNSNHTLWSYSIVTGEITQVIGNITGGFAGTALNLDPEYKIFHSNVVDNILYWTDGLNPPRKLDLYKAIKYFESDGTDAEGYPFSCFSSEYLSSFTMDVVKAPPTFIIQGEYITNQNKNFNKLYGNQYQFRYQYVYENNEESKWSMISKQPFPPSQEFISGRDIRDSLKYNEIELTYFTGAYNVKQINFAFRRGENGSWLVFKQLDLQAENVPNAIIDTLIFDDNVAPQGATLTDILYDNVPQTALCQEILPNQSLAYGNFYADYDLLPQIDVQGERVLNELYDADVSRIPTVPIIKTGAPNDDYPANIILIDIGSWATRFFIFDAGVAIDPVLIDLLNTETTPFQFLEGDVIPVPLYKTDVGVSSLQNYYYTLTYNDVFRNGRTNLEMYSDLCDSIVSSWSIEYPDLPIQIGYADDHSGSPTTIIKFLYIDPSDNYGIVNQGDFLRSFSVPYEYVLCKVLRKNRCVTSLKKGSKKVFGIQYYDRANRSNSVQTTPEMIIDIPLPGQELGRLDFQYNIDPQGYYGSASAYTVSSKFTINHLPPDWATHYSILVKKDELISSFMQTTITAFSYEPLNPYLIKLNLDKIPNSGNNDYYTTEYNGATFYHTPSKGDRIRFITMETTKNPYPKNSETGVIIPNPYTLDYVELEVIKYESETNSILVNDFDFRKKIGGASNAVGALVEIYTPKRDVAEDVWFEIETFPIYTGNDGVKYHQANDQVQTNSQPAILSSDYGDVYYRMRDLATGIYYNNIYDTVEDMEADVNSKRLNSISFVLYVPAEISDVWISYLAFNYLSTGEYNLFYIGLPNEIFINFQTSTHFIEDYNYSDYYVSDGHGRGRIGVENNKTKRTHYKTGVIHSAPYVMGSYINGLSSFDTLGNAEYLDDTFGPINRLKQVGYTLKALQDRKEVSIYIQRSYATSADGSGQLAYTSKTFGGINPSETMFGCVHPGSVQVIENDMYYYDFYTGAVIRSSSNGQSDITSGEYKFNYWISTKTNNITKQETKTFFGKTYHAVYTPISLIDEQNTEYTLNFVKTYVADKRFENLPIEIYDSNIGPTFNYLQNRWKMFVDYDLYWAESLGMNVFSFNSANLYEHNIDYLADGTSNELTFYGEQKTMSVEFVMNDSPVLIKRPLSIGFRSNKVFSVPSITTQGNASYPAMSSMLYLNNFKLREGYWWSAYLRDMNTPNKTPQDALINGRELRGYAIIHNIEYSSNEKAVLFDVKCTYTGSEAFI